MSPGLLCAGGGTRRKRRPRHQRAELQSRRAWLGVCRHRLRVRIVSVPPTVELAVEIDRHGVTWQGRRPGLVARFSVALVYPGRRLTSAMRVGGPGRIPPWENTAWQTRRLEGTKMHEILRHQDEAPGWLVGVLREIDTLQFGSGIRPLPSGCRVDVRGDARPGHHSYTGVVRKSDTRPYDAAQSARVLVRQAHQRVPRRGGDGEEERCFTNNCRSDSAVFQHGRATFR